MSVPPEYTEAKDKLIAFRNKILIELVGGRVNAGLDAGHDSMQKFSGVIDGLSVVPYLFGRVREYALALKFKNMDVGTGEIRRLGANWTGGLGMFPNKVPYKVPQRNLPPVDEFHFTPIADLDLLAKTETAKLRTFVLLQVDHDKFCDEPSAENAVYEYFEFVPVQKFRSEYDIVNPRFEFSTYNHFHCERALFACVLRGLADGVLRRYYVDLFIDALGYDGAGNSRPLPIMWSVSATHTDIDATISMCGQHQKVSYLGMWSTAPTQVELPVLGSAPVAHAPIGDAWNVATPPEELVWENHFTMEIAVNNEAYGYTNPPVGTKQEIKFANPQGITAYPNAGYKLDHWEIHGGDYGDANPIQVVIYRDTIVRAIFVPM